MKFTFKKWQNLFLGFITCFLFFILENKTVVAASEDIPRETIHLVSLNIWGGYIREPLLDFVRSHQEVDIFCFQEVYHNATQKMSTDDKEVSFDICECFYELLPGHRRFFHPVLWDSYGISIFVRTNINILEDGYVSIYTNPDYPGCGPAHDRDLQWLKCEKDGKVFTVINVHGLWNGKGKTDSPERLSQSQKISKFIQSVDTPKLLCGDFNLRPDTESIRIVEGESMRNLVKECGITSTRTSLYDKEEKYADYIFTSPEIKVWNLEVWDDVVSDHVPLSIIFSI